jgi:hypothetical protein
MYNSFYYMKILCRRNSKSKLATAKFKPQLVFLLLKVTSKEGMTWSRE